jgi:transcriptional regulator with XRE-family HTH domain
MPKRSSSTVKSDLVDLARGGSSTAVLLLCAIQKGLTMSEIADRAGVTRQAVSNWASGSDGNSGSLKQLITYLEIDINEIESVLSQIFPKAQNYEPHSLRLSVINESLSARLKEIHKEATSPNSCDIDTEGDSFFQKGFLSKNLKELFYFAFKDKARGFDLAIVRGPSCDDEAWRVFCEKYVDDQTCSISIGSSLWEVVYRSEPKDWEGEFKLSDVCRSYGRLKLGLNKICKGLELAPASNANSRSQVVIGDVLWERYDYDRSNHIDYFFYWLSDRDGQEFFGCIFEQIKDRIARAETELCVFFHDAVDRSVIKESLSYWNEDTLEEETQPDDSIFGNWNAANKAGDPSKRMRDLGYVIDFKNEEWAQDITEDVDWIVFIGASGVKFRTRFLIPKSCALSAFEALLKSLGYNAKVKALTKQKDIHGLAIRW